MWARLDLILLLRLLRSFAASPKASGMQLCRKLALSVVLCLCVLCVAGNPAVRSVVARRTGASKRTMHNAGGRTENRKRVAKPSSLWLSLL
jgi:hypothetical protein